MTSATSRITLAATTVYNLYNLLTDTTYAGICSAQYLTTQVPYSVRSIVVKNFGTAGEIVYLSSAGPNPSATHYFEALNNTEQWVEKEDNSSGRPLTELNLFASAQCVIAVRVDWM